MLGVVIDALDGVDQGGEAKHDLKDKEKLEVGQVFLDNFKDLMYMCLVTLNSQTGEESLMTQANTEVKRLGYAKLRALEVVKHLLTLREKETDPPELNELLCSRMVDTMIMLLEEYPNNSLMCQLCVSVIKSLKD